MAHVHHNPLKSMMETGCSAMDICVMSTAIVKMIKNVVEIIVVLQYALAHNNRKRILIQDILFLIYYLSQ
jgi:hypothetical protein